MSPEPPVAPDDTPTRLHSPEIAELVELRADVSRLREALDLSRKGEAVLLTGMKDAEAEVSRLQQEHARLHKLFDAMEASYGVEVKRLAEQNALLRRSLEMLTKQLEEAERDADNATEELLHPRD